MSFKLLKELDPAGYNEGPVHSYGMLRQDSCRQIAL
jgi:hypothetical protein